MLIDFNKDIVNFLIKKVHCNIDYIKHNNIINVKPDNKELGFAGIPETITQFLNKIINKIPVIAPLGIDKDKNTYNINGDTAASAIAKNLNQDFYS